MSRSCSKIVGEYFWQVSFGLRNIFWHPTISSSHTVSIWDRKYAFGIGNMLREKNPPISSYLIQNYICMCPDQCEWIWDRLFSLFICEKSFWDRKIPFLGSKKRNSPKPHNYQNLKLKTTFRKTTLYCTKWYLMLVEVILEYRESIISSFPTS